MRRFLHFIRQKAFQWAHLSHRLVTGVNIQIKTPMEWRIYNDIFVDGDYDEPIQHVLSRSSSQSLTVLDLGSNVGYFMLRFIHLVLLEKSHRPIIQIQGVEGNKVLSMECSRRLQTAGFSSELFQIKIDRGLVGLSEGTGTLYGFKDHGLNSVFRKNGKPETVPFLNLPNLVASWPEIGLLKCDIEGSELSFLENNSGLMKKTGAAVFEFHTEFCNYEQCLRLIQAAGLTHQKLIRSSPFSRIEFFWK